MIRKQIIAFIFVTIFIISGFTVYKISYAFDCTTELNSSSTAAEKQICQNELSQIEDQLKVLLAEQQAQSKQTGTLKGDITYLTSQINALVIKVKARSLAIAKLKVDINDKISAINILSAKIDAEHESLAQLLRNTNEFDNENISYLILSNNNISDFYSDLESYNSIQRAVKTSVDEINNVKTENETQKKELETQKNAETDAKAELVAAQNQVKQTEIQKKQLLAISKQKESAYQQLADKEKARANKIRSALFSLAGISQKIEFGTALSYAEDAQKSTGIDPAFLLAILTQESNLGSNVGKCYLTDLNGPQAGYGMNISSGKTWSNLMKPSRDIQPFIDITNKLGLDPLKTVVSCPIAGAGGYGGAMGPAQFIPSTWVLFENRLQNALGYFANPWSPRDAFTASAMFLTDLGASGNSASSQIRAACKYYGTGGSSCSYGRSVMKLKATIQNNIDYLERYGVSKQ